MPLGSRASSKHWPPRDLVADYHGCMPPEPRNQPWASIVAFSADMYRLWRFTMTHSASFFKGGSRQKERGWLSMVSFIPEPSGSNENIRVPARDSDEMSVMR